MPYACVACVLGCLTSVPPLGAAHRKEILGTGPRVRCGHRGRAGRWVSGSFLDQMVCPVLIMAPPPIL